MSKKWLLSLSFAVLVFVMVACGDEDETAEDNNETEEPEMEEPAEQPEMPEPDLEGVPDVVAEVNGEEIPRDEFEATYQGQFQQAMMQAQMSGQEIDQDQLKEQVAESMIGTELLVQEADNAGFDASEEEMDETLDELIEMNQLESREEFMSAMEQQGMGEEEVMDQVELQVKLDKLITSEAGDTEPTEEEVEEFYEQFAAQQEEMGGAEGEEVEVPSFDELKPELEQELRNQKEGEASQVLVENLREEADVTNHL
ncbi:peptidyl-prolyl cis-trans isomerase SurA [Virgibacillus natechei]|uniref:Peptidyl-prolyl cis-trans isomerase SurA n=1 Tax=Virgibacillus natechei TaxID=1216297 RepID=A0ABS4IE32_9BACI|nr:SurA N-terminal domain-containing protein [Virgibacillus natechei]MBP1969113.1 peptidyl-prolyl cis-trans isomerase SurA [Virgibacillus natechei]UZD14379.1 SurA N-terminal domain-containing protein [Virgibacillus natechei]